jgi:hypothetical protein
VGARATNRWGLIAANLHWGGLSSPYIRDAIRYLNVTSRGRQWIKGLYSNVFRTEHVLQPPAQSNLRPEKAPCLMKRRSKWLLGVE